MGDDTYFSVRMRASREGKHISGAERIVPAGEISETSQRLIQRALGHPKGSAASITVSVDAIPAADITYLPPLECIEVDAPDHASARQWALQRLGLFCSFPERAWEQLCAIKDMRGAMILHAQTGQALHPNAERGVRVSALDSTGTSVAGQKQHHHEAMVLAAKVAHAPHIVGELCISDDPDYTTGYLAAEGTYFRIPHLKLAGSEHGGRIFFYQGDANDLAATIDYLENTPVLVGKSPQSGKTPQK